MKLRIGHLSTFYHTAVILMAESSLAAKLGADVEWRLFGTGPAIVDAFERGELDLAYIGLPPAIIGIARGVRIVCIAGGHVEGTVITGKKELRGFPEERALASILSQMEGRRIGVPGKGSIHDVILSHYLEEFGLMGKVEVANYAWSDRVTEAMARGEVSAAIGTPALAVAVKWYADGRILYPPSMIWPNNPSYGILVDRNFLDEERGTTERFLVLHEEAESLLRKDPRKAASMISAHVGFVEESFVLETLQVSPRYCAKLTEGYVSSTMELAGAQRKLGYMTREVSAEEIFDLSLIEKVHPEADHYREDVSESA